MTFTYPRRNTVKRVVLALERLLALGESEESSSGKRRPAQPRFLPALTALLLTAQPESYTFCTIREMAHAADQYFPVTTMEYRAWNRALADVLHKLHPSTATYLQNLGFLTDVDINNETKLWSKAVYGLGNHLDLLDHLTMTRGGGAAAATAAAAVLARLFDNESHGNYTKRKRRYEVVVRYMRQRRQQ